MSTTVSSTRDIPKAKYYVLSNDSFMSGWGMAKGKTNTVICPCHDWQEAQFIEQYVKSRSGQKRIRIVSNKPRLSSGVLYSLMEREESAWYTAYFTVSRSMKDSEYTGKYVVNVDDNVKEIYRHCPRHTEPRMHPLSQQKLNSLLEVITYCSALAYGAGARQIEIDFA